jgi:hypothetical protein
MTCERASGLRQAGPLTTSRAGPGCAGTGRGPSTWRCSSIMFMRLLSTPKAGEPTGDDDMCGSEGQVSEAGVEDDLREILRFGEHSDGLHDGGARPKSRAIASLTAGESQSPARRSRPASDPRPACSARGLNGTTLATGGARAADDDLFAVFDTVDDARQVRLGVVDVVGVRISSHRGSLLKTPS